MQSRTVWAVLALVAAGLAGCSGDAETARKADYAQAKSLPPLEVPPDLVEPVSEGGIAVPDVNTSGEVEQPVLPRKSNVQIHGSGKERWLALDTAPEKAWRQVREFWLENGFELKREEPAIGIIETEWAENRADIPEGGIRGLLGGIFPGLYSAATRDRFRTRLERTEDGRTEVFVTHYGVEQVVTGNSSESEVAVWRPRASDPELVNEMLNRLVAFLGVDPAKAPTAAAAETKPRAELVGDSTLLVHENFARAWRRTGLALDQLGLLVEDRNRAEGLYYARWSEDVQKPADEEKGFFSGLFSGSDDAGEERKRMQLRLIADGAEETRLSVLDPKGEPLPAERSRAILTELERLLR